MRPTRNPAVDEDVLAKQKADYEARGGKVKKIAQGVTKPFVGMREQQLKNLEKLKAN